MRASKLPFCAARLKQRVANPHLSKHQPATGRPRRLADERSAGRGSTLPGWVQVLHGM